MPGRLGMLPAAMPFIIFCISLNCLRSVLTSATVEPEPRAMRLRRDPSSRLTSARSAGVMEHTMASTREISPSSIWPAAWRISLDMPGISFIRPPSEPIFLTCLSWERKSSRVNWPDMRRAAPLATSSWSMVRSACSMRLSTSPIPRIRSAIRSGWNRSKSARRSPVLAKAIGFPTTPLTDRAAPPRASPSSLERITASRARVSWNALAVVTASWPIMASMTRNV